MWSPDDTWCRRSSTDVRADDNVVTGRHVVSSFVPRVRGCALPAGARRAESASAATGASKALFLVLSGRKLDKRRQGGGGDGQRRVASWSLVKRWAPRRP